MSAKRPAAPGLARADLEDVVRQEIGQSARAPGDDAVSDPWSVLGRIRVADGILHDPDEADPLVAAARAAASRAANASKTRNADRRISRALELQSQGMTHQQIADLISREDGLDKGDGFSRETVRKWLRSGRRRAGPGQPSG